MVRDFYQKEQSIVCVVDGRDETNYHNFFRVRACVCVVCFNLILFCFDNEYHYHSLSTVSYTHHIFLILPRIIVSIDSYLRKILLLICFPAPPPQLFPFVEQINQRTLK